MNEIDDDGHLLDEEEFYEGALDAIDRRQQLERDGRIAANIVIDLQESGPLKQFLIECRTRAVGALIELSTVDASDQARILALQGEIKLYLRSVSYTSTGLRLGAQAEQTINEEYGPDVRHDADLFEPEPGEPSWRRR